MILFYGDLINCTWSGIFACNICSTESSFIYHDNNICPYNSVQLNNNDEYKVIDGKLYKLVEETI